MTVRNNLRTLEQIKNGESEKLTIESEQSLISLGMYISRHMQSHPGATFWLWKIREYYNPKIQTLDGEAKKVIESLPTSDPGDGERFYNF